MADLHALSELLALPVRVHGIQLGHLVDAILDGDSLRVIGFEVRCADDAVRFLPFAAARVREEQVALGSSLLLLDAPDVGFYRGRGRSFRALRGGAVADRVRPIGSLLDALVASDGNVTQLVVSADGVPTPVPAGDGLSLVPRRAAPAA